MIGSTLSHYEITAELGRGGMGIVYRATDTKLNREVALKILPAAALASEEDRARFFREAQAAAQLHHPNIATVFEIDEAVPEGGDEGEPRPFIAMELIDGESLSDSIKQAPFTLEDSLRIACEIAEALQTAHEKDIVHRDVKSANVMLTTKRTAKVLDFGLAQTNQSTMLTRMGSTLGTVAYMSPEQAQGQTVDHRTDIWALGCVLYEMIIGHQPFGGDYEQAVVYSILNEAPQPVTALRTGVPMSLDWIIGKCLAKSADERYQSMRELLVDLRNVDLKSAGFSRISSTSATVIPSAFDSPIAGKKSFGLRETVGIAGVVVGLIIGFVIFGSGEQRYSERTVSFTYDRIPNFTITDLSQRAVSISEDGKWISVASSGDLYSGRTDVFAEARPIFSEFGLGPHTPMVEPSGNRIGFIDVNGIMSIVTSEGGVPFTVSGSHVGGTGHSWARNGNIYAAFGNQGIVSTPVSGQRSSKVVLPDSSTTTYYGTPLLLPGGRFLMYAKVQAALGWSNASLMALDMESGEERLIFAGGTDPKFVEPDILVFSQSGTLIAGRIDPNDPHKIEGPVPVSNEAIWSLQAVAQYDVSSMGHLIFISGEQSDFGWKLAYHSRDGDDVIDTLNVDKKLYYSPVISPNGRHVAVDFQNPQSAIRELEIVDTQTGRVTPIMTSANVWTPVWSPNGERVVFSAESDETSIGAVMWRSIDLSDEVEVLYETENWSGPDSWSPDGKTILITELKLDDEGGRELLLYDVETGSVTPFLSSNFDEEDGRFSPDGRWIAYTSDRSGTQEVWITSVAPGGGQTKVSNGGGLKARWTPNGNSIVYINKDRLFEVPIRFEDGPDPGVPTQIIDGHYYFHYNTGTMGEYDIHPDGRVLLFDRDTYGSMTGEIRVVLNWGKQIDQIIPPLN